MRIDRDEWDREANIQAARDWGRATYKVRVARRFGPQIGAVVAVAALGFAAWRIWSGLTAKFGGASLPGTADTGVPVWAWLSAVLLLVTVVAFRPGRIDRLSVLILKFLIIASLWLLLAGYVLSSALG
jgi:hypothetical protein